MRHLGDMELSQRAAFWNGEGDKWYERNKHAVVNPQVLHAVLKLQLPDSPTLVEVGCGDGAYVRCWHDAFGGTAYGLDVSEMAIKAAKAAHPGVAFVHSSAHGINRYEADLIVFGFCLYLIDRDDLFSLVALTDRALNPGGYLAIHDFHPAMPQKVPYHHKEGLFSYKMHYADLWLVNPAYEWVSETPTASGETLTIIRKGSWDRWR